MRALSRARRSPTGATFGAESERAIAWLRLPAIVLIAVGGDLAPSGGVSWDPLPSRPAFFAALVAYLVGAIAALVHVHTRPVGERFAVATAAFDVAAITVLTATSGGPFSQTRVAYFVVPIVAAFRFRPTLTAAASGAGVFAYLAQALGHPAVGQPQALRFTAVHAGYLAWAGAAAVALSMILQRRRRQVWSLVETRDSLLNELLSAETRERQTLAETVHDHTIQNLLSIRHELEEATEQADCEPLDRADRMLMDTVRELRELVSELHPYVLEEAGLAPALRLAADRAARRGGFAVSLDVAEAPPGPHDRLLIDAARELLANAAEHASPRRVTVEVARTEGETRLLVADDGVGFDPGEVVQHLADGHIGLASQRLRVESAGGRFQVMSTPGQGSSILIRLPAPRAERFDTAQAEQHPRAPEAESAPGTA
ncbi:MAG TPA: ATP-binding protein [Gaiellaceae bacterium]|nr:ATP-binding protein [Gaiellaceae bacterium]